MPARTHDVGSLKSLVEMAAQQLLSGAAAGGPQDSLLFTGVWHDAYPAILVRDPILPDSAKIQLLYLMQESRANPYGVNPLPSVEKSARELGKSPTTIVRDRAILRMTRWASQCRQVRDPQGRMRGVVYALHGEPASLAEATALDPGYMGLLEQAAGGHFDRIARRVAHTVLAAIDADIHEGRDPLESANPMERRLEALQTLQAGTGRFFSGFLSPGNKQPDSNPETGETGPEPLIPTFETSARESLSPVSNIETGEREPPSRIGTGTGHSVAGQEMATGKRLPDTFADSETRYCGERNPEPDAMEGGHTVAGQEMAAGKRLPDTFTDSETRYFGDRNPEPDAMEGGHTVAGAFADSKTRDRSAEPVQAKADVVPRHLPKPETGDVCSSSDLCVEEKDQEKTTTTANLCVNDTGPPLHWPPDFSDNLQRLVLRALNHHLPERKADHQEVVDALAQRLRNKSDPIRNIAGYTAKLCGKVKTGEFCPVQPPTTTGHTPAAVHIHSLRSEIRALEQLVQAASPTGSSRSSLESQLAQRRSQLRELEEPARH